MTEGGVVIVGAGQAGLQTAASLRELAYPGSITLINEEYSLPYQRPPLSKTYMLGKATEDALRLRNRSYFEENNIRLVGPVRAMAIDRSARKLKLASGADLPYDHLVLATGAKNRSLPIKGSDLHGVYSLRTIADAASLRNQLQETRNAVVLGGGFIGMEFAAVAAKLGAQTHVVEVASRIMARATSPEVSAYLTRRHGERGTTFSFNESVVRINGEANKVVSVDTASGATFAADLVLIGVGVVPNQTLAENAGLMVMNGVVVDDQLLTEDSAISAIGDCAVYPNSFSNSMLRLESVQNAVDQARFVAARIAGIPARYAGVPWFWSDQGADKLQIAGIAFADDTNLVKEDEDSGGFSVFRFRNDALVCVESVNRVADHMAARALLKSGKLSSLSSRHVSERDFKLKSYLSKEAAIA
jgi:3-phenylpropionate/trans-cinnamate dioxygenase ferredoxin reductase subunit